MGTSLIIRSRDAFLEPEQAQRLLDEAAPAEGWRCCEPPLCFLEEEQPTRHSGRALFCLPKVLLDSEALDDVEGRTALAVLAMIRGVERIAEELGGSWRLGLGVVWVGVVCRDGPDDAVASWKEALARGELQPAALGRLTVGLGHWREPWPDTDLETTGWPGDLLPGGAPVATRNALVVPIAPDVVWQALVRATDWPRFYANARDVRILDGDELAVGVEFTWRTLGIPVRTRVTELEPQRSLTWRGHTWYGRGCHTWRIEPAGSGCRIVTEEVQRGLVPWMLGWWIRPQLLRWHQRWLEGLGRSAQRYDGQ